MEEIIKNNQLLRKCLEYAIEMIEARRYRHLELVGWVEISKRLCERSREEEEKRYED